MKSVLAALVAFSVPLHARPIELRWLGGGGLGARSVAIEFRSLSGDPSQSAITRVVANRWPTTVDLVPGAWSVDVTADGIWHQRQYVNTAVADGLEIRVWPAAIVRGIAIIKPDTKYSGDVYLPLTRGPDRFEIHCVATDGTFTCSVPAGEFQARIRPRATIAQNIEHLLLRQGLVEDLGTRYFDRGASIIGRVKTTTGVRVDAKVLRVVTTLETGGTATRSSIDDHGFFHIDGIAPGQYIVGVQAGGDLLSRRVRVNVGRESENELSEALVVESPQLLRMLVSPTVDPTGKKWRVDLAEEDAEHVYPRGGSLAAVDGSWISPPLFPGQYRLRVETSDGQRWHVEHVSLSERYTPLLHVLIATRMVRGSVRLRKTPLQASLKFEDESGITVTTKSDDEGRFTAEIPSGGSGWTVTAQSDLPRAKRRFRDVLPASGDANLELEFPSTLLMGDVKTDEGVPVPSALINISRMDADDRLLQPTAEKDGSFQVEGVTPGRYRVAAVGEQAQSDPAEVVIEANVEPEPLHLIIHRDRFLRGRVISPLGPASGAVVRAFPIDKAMIHDVSDTTDMNGRFSLELPHGTTAASVVIFAPGFACRAFRSTVPEQPVTFLVGGTGGDLTIATDAPGDEIFTICVHHEGAEVPLVMLQYEWNAKVTRGQGSGALAHIPMIEPGVYDVCQQQRFFVQPQQCKSVFVPPYGEAKVELSVKSRPK